MISFNSLKNFLFINLSLIGISLFEYWISDSNIMIFNSKLLRNFILLNAVDYITKNNNLIESNRRIEPKEEFPYEFNLFFISSTLIEGLTHIFIKEKFYSNVNTLEIIDDLKSFIPVSFIFEIIFDLFHYTTHLILHNNLYLYRNIHKIHHKFKYPNSITTFYHHPLDLLFTNSLPVIITIICMPIKPTYFQFILLSTFKTIIEISGHSGKIIKSSCFPQFIWLPKFLNIELRIEDHDLHHSMNNCNYSKRFSLWDKIFRTYLNEKCN